jgi:hypothetical protein
MEISMPKTKQKIEYRVPPLLVNDLTSQCAAYFLNELRSRSDAHIKDILRCGLRGSGGLVEEVEYWLDRCSGGDGWFVEDDGPWVYDSLHAKDVAAVVWRHTRGWSLQDYIDYGYTTTETEARDTSFSRALQQLS